MITKFIYSAPRSKKTSAPAARLEPQPLQFPAPIRRSSEAQGPGLKKPRPLEPKISIEICLQGGVHQAVDAQIHLEGQGNMLLIRWPVKELELFKL